MLNVLPPLYVAASKTDAEQAECKAKKKERKGSGTRGKSNGRAEKPCPLKLH